MHLERLSSRFCLDGRNQRSHALLGDHARSVIQQQRIDVRRCRQLVRLVGVIRVVVNGRQGVHQRACHLRAEFLGNLREARHFVDVVEQVVDPKAATAMPVQLTHPSVHNCVGRRAERSHRV